MAAILALDFEDALNIAGSSTPWNAPADRPLFDKDHEVWKLGDLPADASNWANTPKYKVIAIEVNIQTVSTVTKFMDQTQTFATPADGSTARSTEGFQHTDSISGVVAGTSTSRLWFYTIKNVATNEIIRGVHQSRLTDETGWETYLATKIGDIVG